MKIRISIIYSWLIRIATSWLPDIPVIMRFRGWLYSLLMKKCGRNFQVPSTVIINSLTGVSVGDNVAFGHRVIIIALDLEIGDNVLIGPNCLISGGNHTFVSNSYRFGPHLPKKIIIGAGAWVCGNCSVTAGSILPERSVLSAGSVLTRAFKRADGIYAGNPAQYIVETHNDVVTV